MICPWCAEGNPRVESSVNPGKGIYVHTDTPVGRAICRQGPEPPTGVELIAQERARQAAEEGWSAQHDDTHTKGELALAAIAYASPAPVLVQRGAFPTDPWPWGAQCDKRPFLDAARTLDPRKWSLSLRVSLLIKAGALIAAEIDRLLRLEKRGVKLGGDAA